MELHTLLRDQVFSCLSLPSAGSSHHFSLSAFCFVRSVIVYSHWPWTVRRNGNPGYQAYLPTEERTELNTLPGPSKAFFLPGRGTSLLETESLTVYPSLQLLVLLPQPSLSARVTAMCLNHLIQALFIYTCGCGCHRCLWPVVYKQL